MTELASPEVQARVTESFARQGLMQTLGAELVAVRQGEVEISMPFRSDLTQQQGFLHAATVTAIVDSACGYAAMSLLPEGQEVLSIEFKVNFLLPAAGERFVAVGRVLRAGKKVTVCAGEVHAITGDERKFICVMQATMIAAQG